MGVRLVVVVNVSVRMGLRVCSRRYSVGVGLGVFTYLVLGTVVDLLVGVGIGVGWV